jgi:hypothetical protein
LLPEKEEKTEDFPNRGMSQKRTQNRDGGVNVSWRNEGRVECVLSISVESVFA